MIRRFVRCGMLGLLLVTTGSAKLAAAESEHSMTTAYEYVGSSAELPVAFRYPGAWRLTETTGRLEPYRQARLDGPRNSDDTFTASFIARSSPLRAKRA